jgi:hypothetical protein
VLGALAEPHRLDIAGSIPDLGTSFTVRDVGTVRIVSVQATAHSAREGQRV